MPPILPSRKSPYRRQSGRERKKLKPNRAFDHSTNLGHKTSPVRRGFHFVHRLWPAAGCYLLDLLRLRNMLAAPANPAPMMAIQGVSLATAANNTRVNS